MLIEHVKRESRQGIRNALPKVCFMFRRYFFNAFGVERKRAYGLIDCSIALMTLLKIHIRYSQNTSANRKIVCKISPAHLMF